MTFEARITNPDDIPIDIKMTMTRHEWGLVLNALRQGVDYVCVDVSTLLRETLMNLEKSAKLEKALGGDR